MTNAHKTFLAKPVPLVKIETEIQRNVANFISRLIIQYSSKIRLLEISLFAQ